MEITGICTSQYCCGRYFEKSFTLDTNPKLRWLPELLLRIAGECIVEGAHRLLHPGFAFNIVVYIAIDFFVNLCNLSYAFKSIFLEGSIGFLRLSKGL